LPFIEKSKVILELGCGDGYSTFVLSKKLLDSTLIDIDISPLFVKFAKEKSRKKISFIEYMTYLIQCQYSG